MDRAVRISHLAITGAALAFLMFFAIASWILWQNRGLRIEPLITAWKEAAPARGNVDALLTKAETDLPPPSKIQGLLTAATDTLGAAKDTATATQRAVSATSANLNRPCAGNAGPDACGTLAQWNKTVIKAGDAIVTTQDEEKDEVIPHTLAAMDALAAAGGGVNDFLKSEAVRETAENLAGTAENMNTLSGNAAKVSDKLTNDFLARKPWWKRVGADAEDLLKLAGAGAALAK